MILVEPDMPTLCPILFLDVAVALLNLVSYSLGTIAPPLLLSLT